MKEQHFIVRVYRSSDCSLEKEIRYIAPEKYWREFGLAKVFMGGYCVENTRTEFFRYLGMGITEWINPDDSQG